VVNEQIETSDNVLVFGETAPVALADIPDGKPGLKITAPDAF
jgi:hypothetical protein